MGHTINSDAQERNGRRRRNPCANEPDGPDHSLGCRCYQRRGYTLAPSATHPLAPWRLSPRGRAAAGAGPDPPDAHDHTGPSGLSRSFVLASLRALHLDTPAVPATARSQAVQEPDCGCPAASKKALSLAPDAERTPLAILMHPPPPWTQLVPKVHIRR